MGGAFKNVGDDREIHFRRKPNGSDPSGDLGVDGKVILKRTVRK
jgi:hypothetical protein